MFAILAFINIVTCVPASQDIIAHFRQPAPAGPLTQCIGKEADGTIQHGYIAELAFASLFAAGQGQENSDHRIKGSTGYVSYLYAGHGRPALVYPGHTGDPGQV